MLAQALRASVPWNAEVHELPAGLAPMKGGNVKRAYVERGEFVATIQEEVRDGWIYRNGIKIRRSGQSYPQEPCGLCNAPRWQHELETSQHAFEAARDR